MGAVRSSRGRLDRAGSRAESEGAAFGAREASAHVADFDLAHHNIKATPLMFRPALDMASVDEHSQGMHTEGFAYLGRVDKRDSHRAASVIQADICDGDQLGTRPDVGRGMGFL